MTKTTLSKFGAAALAIAVAIAGYVFINQSGQDKARASVPAPQVPVTAAIAETKDVPQFVRGIGTVQAYKTVTIKTRVDGEIVKVAFKEGQEVKAGDQLFQIDPRPYQAALDAATATKRRNEAQLKASVAADRAAIDTAQLNLAFADIRAPIDGRTGQRLVDLGNLVQAAQGTNLVTITQVKPIFVNFTVPQDYTDAIRHNQTIAPLTVLAYGSDDKTLVSEGKLSLIDNQIDMTTGTLRLKATFANADERLWPGEFVNVRLVLSTRTSAVTIPQRAVMQGATGYYAYVIRPDGTVERRVVEIAGMQDGLAIIDKGIADQDKIVVDGQYRLTNGARIKLEEAKPEAQSPASAAKAG